MKNKRRKKSEDKNIKHGLLDTRNERERKERGRRGFFLCIRSRFLGHFCLPLQQPPRGNGEHGVYGT